MNFKIIFIIVVIAVTSVSCSVDRYRSSKNGASVTDGVILHPSIDLLPDGTEVCRKHQIPLRSVEGYIRKESITNNVTNRVSTCLPYRRSFVPNTLPKDFSVENEANQTEKLAFRYCEKCIKEHGE